MASKPANAHLQLANVHACSPCLLNHVESCYPLVNIQKAMENGHWNSGFSHEKWWIFPWQYVSSPEGKNPLSMCFLNINEVIFCSGWTSFSNHQTESEQSLWPNGAKRSLSIIMMGISENGTPSSHPFFSMDFPMEINKLSSDKGGTSIYGNLHIWLVVDLPILKNDGVRQWEGWHPIYEMEHQKMFETFWNQISWFINHIKPH